MSKVLFLVFLLLAISDSSIVTISSPDASQPQISDDDVPFLTSSAPSQLQEPSPAVIDDGSEGDDVPFLTSTGSGSAETSEPLPDTSSVQESSSTPTTVKKSFQQSSKSTFKQTFSSSASGSTTLQQHSFSHSSLGGNFLSNPEFRNSLAIMQAVNRERGSKLSEYVLEVILENRKRIQEHNERFLQHLSPYKMKQNRFIKFTTEEFREIFLNLWVPTEEENVVTEIIDDGEMGDINDGNGVSRRLLQTQSEPFNYLTAEVDWKAARKMTSVKYQRECGSCYAFTSIGVIESAYILKGKYLNLAEQELVDCSEDFGNKGCIGGWTGYAFKYIAEHGVVYEATYPYHNVKGQICGRTTPGHRANSTRTFNIRSYIRLGKTCDQVVSALMQRPLAVAVNADGWQHYSDGVFMDCEAGQVNHGVVLAGVNEESWLIKNSWGYAWGENGYMRLGRGADNDACGICKYASYVNVDL